MFLGGRAPPTTHDSGTAVRGSALLWCVATKQNYGLKRLTLWLSFSLAISLSLSLLPSLSRSPFPSLPPPPSHPPPWAKASARMHPIEHSTNFSPKQLRRNTTVAINHQPLALLAPGYGSKKSGKCVRPALSKRSTWCSSMSAQAVQVEHAAGVSRISFAVHYPGLQIVDK